MVILILRSSIVAINLLRNGSREGRKTKHSRLGKYKKATANYSKQIIECEGVLIYNRKKVRKERHGNRDKR